MKRQLVFAVAVLAWAAFCTGGCAKPQEQHSAPAGPPPLEVDEDAPLLLDEPPASDKPPSKEMLEAIALNRSCFVCHANYREEPMAVQHALAKVGCVNCHGESDAHRNDENNTTPPEIMFAKDKIDPACRKCHATHNAPAVKVLRLWRERCPEKTDPATILCTDCHGEHRLKRRTVRWDKKTGKLIPDPGDR